MSAPEWPTCDADYKGILTCDRPAHHELDGTSWHRDPREGVEWSDASPYVDLEARGPAHE